jgi:Flp pilus assembly protein TadD
MEVPRRQDSEAASCGERAGKTDCATYIRFSKENMLMADRRSITTQGFLAEFKQQHFQMSDRSFCFILGAGASFQSGIPTGTVLVKQWLEELHVREDFQQRPLEEWANAENLDIDDFDYQEAASYYPQVFKRRFQNDADAGYAFLEYTMNNREPSYGYIVLAQILAHTRHKVVITTNFDNLVADALSIYTRTFPLICGHESLTGFVRAQLRRPLIAKIHRDLLLEPINTPEGTAILAPGWVKALAELLQYYTPVVIGYGGNDGSLMNFLNSLQRPIRGGIFWCHRVNAKVDDKVSATVAKHHGKLVPIVGFDEIMLQLQQLLGLPDLSADIESRTKDRLTAYRKQFEVCVAKIQERGRDVEAERAKEPVRRAAAAAVERIRENNWWAWELKARKELDSEKREAIYREGLTDFPNSPELFGNFAMFMEDVRQNYDEAERSYRKSLELNPNDAEYTGNFAIFMQNIRKNYDEAERLYRRSLELNPSSATHTGNFAMFMEEIRRNYDEAERLYRKALELNPNDGDHTENFAIYMENVRQNYDEAERLYRKALELAPDSASYAGNLAIFMHNVRHNYDEAERLYRKSLALNPDDADYTANYAMFLEDIRHNYDEASKFYRRALELDPQNKFARKNYEIIRRKHKAHAKTPPLKASAT